MYAQRFGRDWILLWALKKFKWWPSNEIKWKYTYTTIQHWIQFRFCVKRQQLYPEAFFRIECIMKKSGWESLVTFLWLKAFFPSFIPGLNKVQWGIKLPVLNYSLYFKIECMHAMFLKLGGGSVIHGKLKACWVNNLLWHSNNFQLKFLDPNKGKQDHSVILQQFREGKRKRWERDTLKFNIVREEQKILLSGKNLLYIYLFPLLNWQLILKIVISSPKEK